MTIFSSIYQIDGTNNFGVGLQGAAAPIILQDEHHVGGTCQKKNCGGICRLPL